MPCWAAIPPVYCVWLHRGGGGPLPPSVRLGLHGAVAHPPCSARTRWPARAAPWSGARILCGRAGVSGEGSPTRDQRENMEPEEFDENLLRHLLAMLVNEDGINDRLTAAIERLEGWMEAPRAQIFFLFARMDSYLARSTIIWRGSTAIWTVWRATCGGRKGSTPWSPAPWRASKRSWQRVVRGSGNGREA